MCLDSYVYVWDCESVCNSNGIMPRKELSSIVIGWTLSLEVAKAIWSIPTVIFHFPLLSQRLSLPLLLLICEIHSSFTMNGMNQPQVEWSFKKWEMMDKEKN